MTTTASPTATRRRGPALALLLTCQLMLMLDVTVMNVALPRIRADLGFSLAGLSWVMNAYTLVFGGLLLLGGRLGDLFGRRRVFLAGVAVFTVASLAGGLADSGGLLIAARILQGVGAAAAGPSTLALITSTFTEQRERVRALSLFAAMSSSGFAIGLIAGGLLTEWLTWRAVMFINVPLGLAILALTSRHVPAPARVPARLDLAGAITATLGVGGLVYGFIRAAEAGWDSPTALGSLAGGLALLAVFLVVEARTEQPLLPLRLFRDRNRAAGYANFFLGPLCLMSAFFFLTQFLQENLGFGALATGFAFLPMALSLFGMSRLLPALLPRLGAKPLTVMGTTLVTLGMVWLSGLAVDTGYVAGVLGPMVLIGVGAGLGFTALSVVIMGNVPADDAGAAGGTMQTVQQLGATLGLAVVVTVASGSGMNAAFLAAACFGALTVAVSFLFR